MAVSVHVNFQMRLSQCPCVGGLLWTGATPKRFQMYYFSHNSLFKGVTELTT